MASPENVAELVGILSKCKVMDTDPEAEEKDSEDYQLAEPRKYDFAKDDDHFYAHSAKRISSAVPFKIQPHYKGAPPLPTKQEIYVQSSDKKSRRVLFFEGKIRQIHTISLAEETFEATFHFYLTWLASEDDIKSYLEMKQADDKGGDVWEPPSTPTILVDNAITDEKTLLKSSMVFPSRWSWIEDWMEANGEDAFLNTFGFDPRWGVFARVQYEFRGAMLEEFELQGYPFDCQDLKMVLQVKDDKCSVVPIPSNFVSFDSNKSVMADLRVKAICAEFGTFSGGSSRSRKRYPRVALVLKTQREWKSRLGVLLSVGILTFLSLVTFVMNPTPGTDIGNRVNYLMTLILTDIALQQSLRDKLDDFEYLTTADKYILSSFFFKVAVLVWVCIPFYPIYGHQMFADVVKTDVIGTWCFCVGYILFITFWFIQFLVTHYLEQLKLYKSTSDLAHQHNQAGPSEFSIKLDPTAFGKLETNGISNYRSLIHYGFKEMQLDDAEQSSFVHPDIKSELMVYPSGSTFNRFSALKIEIPKSFQVLGVLGAILITGIFWTVMYKYPTALWEQIFVQTLIIYTTCFVVNFISHVLFAEKQSTSNWDTSPRRTQYNHELGRQLAFVAQGVFAVIMSPLRAQNAAAAETRGIIMHVLAMSWYGTRLIGDGILLFRFRDEKNRLLGKFTAVIGKKKWVTASIIDGCRVFITALPLFVVQSATSVTHRRYGYTLESLDSVGIIIGFLAFAIMILCYIYGDSQWSWNKHELIEHYGESGTVHPPGICSCCGGARVSEEVEMYHRSRGLIAVEDGVEAVDDENMKEESWFSCSLNPFDYIRYPLRAAEIVLWVAFWIISIEVFKYDVFALIAILSPICLMFHHNVVTVPLLDVIGDHEFGVKIEYHKWKDATVALIPFTG